MTDKQPKKTKVHSLTGRITWELMQEAFRAVRRNRGAAGTDRVSIEMYQANLDADIKGFFDNIPHRVIMEGLALSAEKTKIAKFTEGFDFLGFRLTSWSVRMRTKSVQKFKTRIRELTVRHRNLDAEMTGTVNAVVRGVANYFATPWTQVRHQFRDLDEWLRMWLRASKRKRKSRMDNCRIRVKHLRRLGCEFLSDVWHRSPTST